MKDAYTWDEGGSAAFVPSFRFQLIGLLDPWERKYLEFPEHLSSLYEKL